MKNNGDGWLAELIPFHLDGLREGGEAVPSPEIVAEWVEV